MSRLSFPYLKPEDRLMLQMLVLDEDLTGAQEFIAEYCLEIEEGDRNSLAICKDWLKRIVNGEKGKLQIRLTDNGPTMDLF